MTGSHPARLAAELVEHAREKQQFWNAHIKLMTRSDLLTAHDLRAIATDPSVSSAKSRLSADVTLRATARVDADIASAGARNVTLAPTVFIDDRRYDGPWDGASVVEALMRLFRHRLRVAVLDFASWVPAAGVSLLAMTLAAVALTTTASGGKFTAFSGCAPDLSLAGVTAGCGGHWWNGDSGLRVRNAHSRG